MIRRLLWLILNNLTRTTGLESREINKEQQVPIIPAGSYVWIKVKPLKSKPVGILMADTIANGRILWLWCKIAPGTQKDNVYF